MEKANTCQAITEEENNRFNENKGTLESEPQRIKDGEKDCMRIIKREEGDAVCKGRAEEL